MCKKNRKNFGKALKKEGGEDKIKLGLHREMKVVTETHSISDMARMDKGTTSKNIQVNFPQIFGIWRWSGEKSKMNFINMPK
jgi:hypothetical protein